MPLQLTSITFRTNGGLVVPVAIKTGTVVIQPPEWPGASMAAADNPLAIVSPATGAGIPIRIALRRDNDIPDAIQVQALPKGETPNLFGGVRPGPVQFAAGAATTTAALILDGPAAAMVQVHNDSLQWQWTPANAANWQDFGLPTQHRVFTLLGAPGKPFRGSALWTDVLEFVCSWAKGTTTLPDAQSAIASKFYSLGTGGGPFKYCDYAQYSNGVFDCAHMLGSLLGQSPGNRVNCGDVAATVSTFSNAIGGTLQQGRMNHLGTNPYTQPIEVIGDTVFAAQKFGYHEVAWANQAQDNDPLWDGCVAFADGMGNPVLALGQRFIDYRPRLMSCVAIPDQAQTRKLGTVTPSAHCLDNVHQAVTRQLSVIQPSIDRLAWEFFPTPDLLPGWRPITPLPGRRPGKLAHIDSYWRREESDADPLVRLKVDTFANFIEARSALICTLHHISASVQTANVGDAGYRDESGQVLVFVRGNTLFQVLNAGLLDYSVQELGAPLDEMLTKIVATEVVQVPEPAPGVKGPIPLPVDLPDHDGDSPAWCRLLASTGTFTIREDRVFYAAHQSGEQTVTLCVQLSARKFRASEHPFLAQ
jgi:hypothetical protein